MKNLVLFKVVLYTILSFTSQAQTTAIPDANFENYLETHAEDGSIVALGDDNSLGDGIANNGLVLTNRIDTVLLLDVSNQNIADLTGIADFVALETLFCSNNNLDVLDISNNVNLNSLVCGSNNLTTLDVSNNNNLETLNGSENQLQNIDVTSNTVLENLSISGNQIAQIDVSNNSELTVLNISNNRIEGELIVSNNTALQNLFCASNQISNLDLSSNTLLKSLDASDNALTSLDLTNINSVVCPDPQTDPVTPCQDMVTINVSENLLNSLVVANGFNDLISVFDASGNPDLFCIQIDAGFTPSGWVKDDWTYYSATTCVDIYTYVPDDNFEQALIDQGLDNVLDNLVLTTNINSITSLDVSNASISSLVGIADFLALSSFNCSNNTLENVDLSNNTSLTELVISNNNISNLNLNANTLLTTLECSGNSITTLDLSANTALSSLNCSNNAISGIDLSFNTALTNLICPGNGIESLDLSSNTALTTVVCNGNNLFALNINNGNNTAITDFNAINNASLTCIKVDDVPFATSAAGWQKDATAIYSLNCGIYVPDDNFEQALIDQGIDSDGMLNNFVPTADVSTITVLDVSGLAITDVTGIEGFLALEDLNLSNNMLNSLDLSANTALQILDCSINEITTLDLTANIALTSVICNYNALQVLNMENGNNNFLTTFYTTENPNLFCINVDDAIVGSIPTSWQKDDFAQYNGDCINGRVTAIPDPFFEQALIDLGYDDVINAQVLTANIEQIQNLDVSDESISALTGIQDFKSIIELNCSGNFLDELDVSNLIYLERLNCSSNYLLTNNPANTNGLFNSTGTESLRALFCANNNLTDLDTSQNTNLDVLDCANNNLDDLAITGNSNLREINCSNNNLTTLDISGNTILEVLNCDNNNLTQITTSAVGNTTLTTLSCASNDLVNLNVNNYQALSVLNCSSNDLSQLNLDGNTDLTYLSAINNVITDIDLQNNTNLVELNISQNDLSQLEVSSNTLLEQLNCSFNSISQLQLSTNTFLEFISCSNNQLTTLDLVNNTNVIQVNCSSNDLSGVILSNSLGALKQLDVSNNSIEGDLDLSTLAVSACVFQSGQSEFCPENIAINVSNNLLEFVNIQNGINADIIDFNASGNPFLECIQVDDTNSIGVNWLKDSTASYSEDCNFGETYVPDDNFEQALINLGLDSGPLNDYVLTANIDMLLSLDVSGNGISDVTGIEDFSALESLNCSNNNITTLDLSSNVNLLNLNCSNNLLSTLEIENNTALVILNCSENAITNMDFSMSSALTNLDISNNSFSNFNPSEINTLEVFNGDNNNLISLDFQQNQLLTSLSCQSNLLETLNVRNGQNTMLLNLNALNNPELTCIETDNGTVPAGVNWIVDTTAQFAVECFFGQTFVPDDNFESALIDLGYDSGALDDYVFTENIENLTFVDLSGREISDLTGIEDFESLIALNVEDNGLTTIDLSNNTMLVDLDISSNLLLDLNLSSATNLTTLDVSDNNLTQINLDLNVNLLNLNISNNELIGLDVAMLSDLEELNCASNLLDGLNLTQNPNLNVLFCQSNMFIADQLNLQNGNNQNLQLFNAINNPDLNCILVDDPIAIINNVDGLYDNWLKDESASYQLVCNDADNDGVANVDDLCPNTPFGATVDLFGCAILNLPNDNFSVAITSETCLNSNNGKIRIEAQELYSYTANLTSSDFNQQYNFTNDVDILNLLANTYELCITVEEWPNYEICYTIIITQPNPLEVFASRMAFGNELALDLNGSSSYHIKFNNTEFTTHNSNLTLQLQQGLNTLKVTTDLECQGVFEKQFYVSEEAFVYPNPFKDVINIHPGQSNENIMVRIYSVYGQLITSQSFQNHDGKLQVRTQDISEGIYWIRIDTQAYTSMFKIVKK